MPKAGGVGAPLHHYQDHDAVENNYLPPILNNWYEQFHEYDVRHLWCLFRQINDEAAAKDIEVRWTIDGNVYFVSVPAANGTWYCVYKNFRASAAGTTGLGSDVAVVNAGYNVDKRGLDYKVEIRIVSALGTNQGLWVGNVWETLEPT